MFTVGMAGTDPLSSKLPTNFQCEKSNHSENLQENQGKNNISDTFSICKIIIIIIIIIYNNNDLQ